jgi:hypothetical protein
MIDGSACNECVMIWILCVPFSLWRRRRRRFDEQKWKNFEKMTLFPVDHVVASHLSHAVIKVLFPPFRGDIPHSFLFLFSRRMSCVIYPRPPKSSTGEKPPSSRIHIRRHHIASRDAPTIAGMEVLGPRFTALDESLARQRRRAGRAGLATGKHSIYRCRCPSPRHRIVGGLHLRSIIWGSLRRESQKSDRELCARLLRLLHESRRNRSLGFPFSALPQAWPTPMKDTPT